MSVPPRIGYHITSTRLVESICEDGLEPGWGAITEHVYLTDAPETALAFATRYRSTYAHWGGILDDHTADSRQRMPLSLLVIDLEGLALEPDPCRPPLPGSWRTTETIGPERITAVIDCDWDDRRGLVLDRALPNAA